MTIRPAIEADRLTFAEVFRDAVRAAGPDAYTPAQVAAWLASADDAAAFGERMLEARPFVAEDETGMTGFATLHPDGYVGMLFVRGDRQRRGIGQALLALVIEAAEAAGLEALHSVASVFSLPVFKRAGFAHYADETVEHNGVVFERYLVRRTV